jgi:CheY-like chemotaxis protein
MPVMDGFELTRKLRAAPATRSVPIIAVTGHAVVATPVLAAEAGCCRLFTKPFLPDDLLDAVCSVLAECPRCCSASEACPCPAADPPGGGRL